nr:Uncharacterised protein [Raoultella sp. NCTC 9187]
MKILVPNFTLAEYARNIWRINALHGQSMDDFKNPESWAHVAANFKRFDEVEVVAEDGSFLLKASCLRFTKTSASIRFYVEVNLEEKVEEQDANAKFAAEWGGGAKWRIVRKSDGEVIESHIATKEEAVQKASKLNQEGE